MRLMSNLRLVFSDVKYKNEYLDFISECREDLKETFFDSVIPISDEETFENDINKLINMRIGKDLPDTWVPQSTYWLLENGGRIIGVVIIRHKLNERLRFRGGHIAYYIRPSERNKGYGNQILSLALERCRDLNLQRVLLTCRKDNIPSSRIIKNNGGQFDSEDIDNTQVIQRYWIELPE